MTEKTPTDTLVCCKCNVPLQADTTNFSYLGHNFSAEVPKCPLCGQVYISEDLVRGKVTAVETELEDK